MVTGSINKKASGNIIVITILFFVALIVLAVMLAPMTFFIGFGVNATNGTQNGSLMAVILNLYPLLMLIMFTAAYAAKIGSG